MVWPKTLVAFCLLQTLFWVGTSQIFCYEGYYSASGYPPCTACPAGKYSVYGPATYCLTCPAGYASKAASASTSCYSSGVKITDAQSMAWHSSLLRHSDEKEVLGSWAARQIPSLVDRLVCGQDVDGLWQLHILDLGCSDGSLALVLLSRLRVAQPGVRLVYVGVDKQQRWLDAANRTLASLVAAHSYGAWLQVRWVQANVFDVAALRDRLGACAFDVVIMSHVAYYTHEPALWASSVARAFARRGCRTVLAMHEADTSAPNQLRVAAHGLPWASLGVALNVEMGLRALAQADATNRAPSSAQTPKTAASAPSSLSLSLSASKSDTTLRISSQGVGTAIELCHDASLSEFVLQRPRNSTHPHQWTEWLALVGAATVHAPGRCWLPVLHHATVLTAASLPVKD